MSHPFLMNRRAFVRTTTGHLLASSAFSSIASANVNSFARHLVATIASQPDLPVPMGKRTPFEWKSATVASANQPPLVLAWPDFPVAAVPTAFRITVGLDERDKKTVEVFLPNSHRIVGTMELWFVSQFQPYELPLTERDIADIRQEGVGLRLTKGSDLEILVGGDDLPAALRPHLLLPGTTTPTEEFFARMNSLACVQQFGWMEGCVLDGLLDLADIPQHAAMKAMAQEHLSLFCKNERLVYENHVCAPSDGKIYGIEGTLPFAALARTRPHSPLLELAVRFWQSRKQSSGSIQDGDSMSSEGSYTVGYALAEVAKTWRSEELMQLALTQVRLRQAELFDGKTFWRTINSNGNRGNRNWARGIAWQILGLVRTLAVAQDRSDNADLSNALKQFAGWVIALQRNDGLWSVFADDPSLTPDAAGMPASPPLWPSVRNMAGSTPTPEPPLRRRSTVCRST